MADTLLATTMVGSYPRPRWFTHQLGDRDVLDAFKSLDHSESYVDATRAVVLDQEQAGLDVVTDGQKLRSLVDGAAIVRAELEGTR